MRKWIWIVIAVVVIAVIAVVISTQVSKEPQTYRVGVIFPFSGSAARLGEIKRNGMLIAVEEINAKGGIAGKELELIFGDSKNQAKEGVTLIKEFTEVKKLPVIVSAMSGVSVSLVPIADEARVVLFANCGHPEVSDRSTYVFRNFITTKLENKVMADFIVKRGFKKLAILVVNDDFGRGLLDVLKKNLEGSTVEIVAEELYEKAGMDFRSLLTKAIQSDPDVAYIGGYGTAAGTVAKQLREVGFEGQILGSDGLLLSDALAIAGDALEGGIMSTAPFDLDSSDEHVRSFVETYAKKYGEEAEVDAAMEYDTVKLIAEAIKRGGYSAEGIKKSLYEIKSFKGLTGELSVLPNGDINIPIVLRIIENGKPVAYSW